MEMQRGYNFVPEKVFSGIKNDFCRVFTGEKYRKSYYENIMIFKEITIMCFLKIIKIMFLTKKSHCVFH